MILCQRLVGQFALRTYKRAQIGTRKAALDTNQHHANFALGAARSPRSCEGNDIPACDALPRGQAGAQHSQSPITAEGGAVIMKSNARNTSGSRRKCVTSDTLAAPLSIPADTSWSIERPCVSLYAAPLGSAASCTCNCASLTTYFGSAVVAVDGAGSNLNPRNQSPNSIRPKVSAHHARGHQVQRC